MINQNIIFDEKISITSDRIMWSIVEIYIYIYTHILLNQRIEAETYARVVEKLER